MARRSHRPLLLRITLAAMALLAAACGAPSRSIENVDAPPSRVTASTVPAMAPDDWHRLAIYGNWDFVDADGWRAIVMSPECDRATALAIFWMLSPEYFVAFADRAAVPAVNRDYYDLLNLIRERWRDGAYTRSELAFDSDVDVRPLDLDALRRRYGARVDEIMPASMRVTLTGRRLERRDISDPLHAN